MPGKLQSNQIGELAATIVAIQRTPHFFPLEIISDSKYVIKGLTENLHNWEDKGWIRVHNAHLFQIAAYLLKRRSAKTSFTWTKGHNGTLGNEESDRLAKEGAMKDVPERINIQIPTEFDLQGAKLATIDQVTAYQGIRQSRTKPPRPDAQENLQTTREALEQLNGTKETNPTIWIGMRKPILRTRVQQFLYKSMHKAYMIGDKWIGIPSYEDRAKCLICQRRESMEHILLECTNDIRTLIWKKAKDIWPHGQNRWPNITIGTILGIGSIALQDEENDIDDRTNTRSIKTRGQTRLLQILVAEASHLIWVIRCERVIHGRNHTEQQVINRWTNKINERLTIDRITTTKIKRDPNFTKLTNATWKDALRKQGIQHENWTHHQEVFSG